MKNSTEAVRARTPRAAWTMVALALLLASAAHAAGTSNALINECNSIIRVTNLPISPEEGQTVMFTLTVASTDSRDNADNPIPQEFTSALFTGDCVQPPGLPCAANTGFMFLGNLGGTCPGVTAVAAAGVVTFTFAPPVSLLVTGTVPPGFTEDSCTITFDGVYAVDGAYAAQANTSGICQNLGFPIGMFNSDTTVTTVVLVTPMMVPTLGEAALAILALILMTGSWMILRRRIATPSRGI